MAAIALTIDVEGDVARLPEGIGFFLELFASLNVKATFFVLGTVAESAPQIVKEISSAGHEIGFHGYQHVPVHQLNQSQLELELKDWRRRLEDLAQKSVTGFRAPFFSICQSTCWALEIISKAGFSYDASIYPGINDRFNWRTAPKRPVRLKCSPLVLFPVPILCPLIPIGFSGGGYLRMLPWFLIAWGFRRQSRRNTPGMIYAHPWEIEVSSNTRQNRRDALNYGWSSWRESKTGHLGRKRMRLRLKQLLAENQSRLVSMEALVSSFRELPEWKSEISVKPSRG